MPKLNPVSLKELIRGLKLFGFEGPYFGGKHPYMIKGDLVLTMPNQHKKDIGTPLLVRLLRQAGISREQWLSKSR